MPELRRNRLEVLPIENKGIPAVPHFSCIGDTRQLLTALLDSYE